MSSERSASEEHMEAASGPGGLQEKGDAQQPAVENAGRPHLLEQIEALKKEQKQLRDERKRVAKEVKNAMRKKKRLRCKASQLTDADLIEVLQMRRATVVATPTASGASASSAANTAMPSTSR